MNVTRYNVTLDDNNEVFIYSDPEGELAKWSDVKPINAQRFDVDKKVDYYGFSYLWIIEDADGEWVWADDLMES